MTTLYVWRGVLRLLHPTMPYISTELWDITFPEADPLISSQLPDVSSCAVDQAAIDHFSTLRDSVVAIRNARSEHGVEPKERIAAHFFVQNDVLLRTLEQEQATIAQLARIEIGKLGFTIGQPEQGDAADSIELVVAAGVVVRLPTAQLGDQTRHRDRLLKQAEKAQATVQKLEARLASKNFRAKAPASVVAKVDGELAEAAEQLSTIQTQLQKLDPAA